ncbi:MAG: hypothetical protein OXC83_03185 [Chloroflexi bacterium]|nr:hypothetical protein [Chloroflexota bacterium]
MVTIPALSNKLPETNEQTRTSFGYDSMTDVMYTELSLSWGVHQGRNPEPVIRGQIDFPSFMLRIADLLKLERQHRERLAAVALDEAAQGLLNALDQETSIRWEDLLEKTEGDWGVASRSAALLVGANLCEVSPTRIRLNEYGDKLLAESSMTDEAHTEIAS